MTKNAPLRPVLWAQSDSDTAAAHCVVVLMRDSRELSHNSRMQPNEIRQCFAYHYWALGQLFNHLAELTPAQLNAETDRFYSGSAFLAMRHLLDVDWSWMQWSMGLPGKDYLWEVEPLPDLAALQAFVAREQHRVLDYLDRLSQEDLAGEVDIGSAQGRAPRWFKRWQILLHIINHGTEHRTELAHYLTDLGHSPGELNFMHYLFNVAK